MNNAASIDLRSRTQKITPLSIEKFSPATRSHSSSILRETKLPRAATP
jgi:hypothetical protein